MYIITSMTAFPLFFFAAAGHSTAKLDLNTVISILTDTYKMYRIVQKSWIRISTNFLAFRGFSTKFRLKRKFGDISANFRNAYCPNPRELSNDISLYTKYRGENSAKMRSSRKFVANFRANFSVLQAFLRKVQTP